MTYLGFPFPCKLVSVTEYNALSTIWDKFFFEMSQDYNIEIDNLKFPRYSGWLYLKESFLTHTKHWCVLSHGYLHYYK